MTLFRSIVVLLISVVVFGCKTKVAEIGVEELSVDVSYSESQAKSFFHKNGRSVSLVRLDSVETRNHRSDILDVDWSKMRLTSTGRIVSYEVPLMAQFSLGSDVVFNDGRQKSVRVVVNLVIQQHTESGAERMFVATMIEDAITDRDVSYMKDLLFSGISIVSDLDGRYVASYVIKKGKQTPVSLKLGVSETNTERSNFSYFGFTQIRSKVLTRRVDGEATNWICGKCNHSFDFSSECPICRTAFGWCPFSIGHPRVYNGYCSGCQSPVYRYLFDVVEIRPPIRCRHCGEIYSNCDCCSICGMDPCVCDRPIWRCPICHDRSCTGNCGFPGGGSGSSSNPGGDGGNAAYPNFVTSTLFYTDGNEQLSQFLALLERVFDTFLYDKIGIAHYINSRLLFQKINILARESENNPSITLFYKRGDNSININPSLFADFVALPASQLSPFVHELVHAYQSLLLPPEERQYERYGTYAIEFEAWLISTLYAGASGIGDNNKADNYSPNGYTEFYERLSDATNIFTSPLTISQINMLFDEFSSSYGHSTMITPPKSGYVYDFPIIREVFANCFK